MAELKLRRLQELNVRLREDLDRRRIPVSEAAAEWVINLESDHTGSLTALSLIAYTDKEPKDFMIPSKWGTVCLLRAFLFSYPHNTFC